jgi:cell division protease FtsH
MARKLIMAYGMSEELGPVALGNNQEMVFLGKDLHEQRNYSEEIARKIDLEINRIMTEGLNRATAVLTQYREYLNKIAQQLIDKFI